MKKGSIRICALYVASLIVTMFVFFPTTALAYFDPGTGSMLLQMLGVIFIAMGGLFVAFKNRIFAFFRKNKGESNERSLEDEEDDE